MLIGFGSDRAVYLFAFAKNERENISNGELLTLREIAASFLDASREKIERAINDGTLIEVHDGSKSKKKAKTSRLTKEMLETTHDMHKSGLLSKAARDKITMRHLGDIPAAVTAKISGADVKAIREQAKLSQAVFARYLNVTAGYVSQLERGDKHPSGPALVLLDVIRRKGIEAIL